MKRHYSQYPTLIKIIFNITDWLETRWATPAYAGWILIGIGLSFFGAATNTMAGWLYVISGMILAILGLNAILTIKNIKNITIERLNITPVTAGDRLTIELVIKNSSDKVKTLLQLIDQLPFVISKPVKTAIEFIPPHQSYQWIYYVPTKKRGVYHWHEVEIKTAAPLGVFYARRSRNIPAKAIIYPQVLPLSNCPLVDTMGMDKSKQMQSERLYQAANEGVTKALRKYRFGDPTRLIHWRSSARFGDLQIRELETITGGQEIIIGLDNSTVWNEDYFEEAVIAAASLYFYASHSQLEVKLWTADTGLIHGNRVVLETLAAIEFAPETVIRDVPNLPLIWISQDTSYFQSLVIGSRWFLFPSVSKKIVSKIDSKLPGIIYNPEEDLQNQLQKPL